MLKAQNFKDSAQVHEEVIDSGWVAFPVLSVSENWLGLKSALISENCGGFPDTNVPSPDKRQSHPPAGHAVS